MPKSVHTPHYQAFLVTLRSQRVAAGLSQRDLARLLKKPPSYVHKCEVGQRQLNLFELRQWCRALSLSWLEMCGEIEEQWRLLDLQPEADAETETGADKA